MPVPYDNLRADLGVDNTVFTDPELDEIWERVSGAPTESAQFNAALGLMARQMYTSTAKLHRYSLVSGSEDEQQVHEHWKTIYNEFKPDLDKVLGTNAQQVGILGIRSVPRQKDKPSA